LSYCEQFCRLISTTEFINCLLPIFSFKIPVLVKIAAKKLPHVF